jgi:hypothetical protein
MCRNPDAEDDDVDGSDDTGRNPLEPTDPSLIFRHDVDPIDDDLHKELDLKDPEEQKRE